MLGVAGGITPSLSATWTPAFPLGCVQLKGGLAINLTAEAGKWGLTWSWTLAEITLIDKTLYSSPGCSPGHWVGAIDITHDATWGTEGYREEMEATGAYSNLEVLQFESGGRQSYSADVSVLYDDKVYYPCPDVLGLFYTVKWTYAGRPRRQPTPGGHPLEWYRGTAFGSLEPRLRYLLPAVPRLFQRRVGPVPLPLQPGRTRPRGRQHPG